MRLGHRRSGPEAQGGIASARNWRNIRDSGTTFCGSRGRPSKTRRGGAQEAASRGRMVSLDAPLLPVRNSCFQGGLGLPKTVLRRIALCRLHRSSPDSASGTASLLRRGHTWRGIRREAVQSVQRDAKGSGSEGRGMPVPAGPDPSSGMPTVAKFRAIPPPDFMPMHSCRGEGGAGHEQPHPDRSASEISRVLRISMCMPFPRACCPLKSQACGAAHQSVDAHRRCLAVGLRVAPRVLSTTVAPAGVSALYRPLPLYESNPSLLYEYSPQALSACSLGRVLRGSSRGGGGEVDGGRRETRSPDLQNIWSDSQSSDSHETQCHRCLLNAAETDVMTPSPDPLEAANSGSGSAACRPNCVGPNPARLLCSPWSPTGDRSMASRETAQISPRRWGGFPHWHYRASGRCELKFSGVNI